MKFTINGKDRFSIVLEFGIAKKVNIIFFDNEVAIKVQIIIIIRFN